MGAYFVDHPSIPVPKPKHERGSRTAKQRGAISAKVANLVDVRSGGACELCGWRPGHRDPSGKRMTLERAHLRRRWKQEETTGVEVAKLCGPSTSVGTCHWWIDYTREGREWAEQYRDQLIRGGSGAEL